MLRLPLAVGAVAVGAAIACSSGGDDAPADASAPDARADVAPVDATIDAADAREASSDAGTPRDASDASPACAPSSDPYSAKWRPPKPRAAVCTPDDLASFWTACWIGGIRSAECTAFTSAHAACGLCIVTSSDADMRGALTVFTQPDLVSLNAPGCVALVDGDASAGSCAAADQALHDCKVETCGTCSTNAAGLAAFQACEAQAQSGGCALYKTAYDVKCAELTNASGALATCLGAGLSQHDYFTAIASFFCVGADGG